MKQSNRIPCRLDGYDTFQDALPVGCFRLTVCTHYPEIVTDYFTLFETAQRFAWDAMENNSWSYTIDCLNFDGRWLPWVTYDPVHGFKRYPSFSESPAHTLSTNSV